SLASNPVLCIIRFCLFFSSTIPRLPISTLFPYTTLFRSRPLLVPVVELLVHLLAIDLDERLQPLVAGRHLRRQLGRQLDVLVDRDRKSTRLNSSHVSISYAVFCLKKKIATSHHSYTRASH